MRFAKGFEGPLENPGDSKARKRDAETGSGICPEYREIDQIMEDYMERREEEEKTKESRPDVDRNKTDQDKATGEEMRERAMERLAQTRREMAKMNHEKSAKKVATLLTKGGSGEGLSVKAR